MARQFICTNSEPVVKTKAGKLRGFVLDGVYTFHGIKYADAKRWQPPVPVKPWDGVKEASNYGFIAPLLKTPMPSDEIIIPHRFWPENEHCQFLNIWTPGLDSGGKRPVMVWIHGGGFTAGSSIEQVAYEGDHLAKYGDAVVISINHRLNILGYFDMSSYGAKYKNSANAGQADIVAALKWINENIAAFGGDPDNVTLFGQSGGGMKITVLGNTPEAEGLFHKGIIMSGITDIPELAGGQNNGPVLVKAILEELGLGEKDVEKLETVPFAVLARASNRAEKKLRKKGTGVSWAPSANEWYSGDPVQTEFSAFSKKFPTMIGSVIGEFNFKPGLAGRHELSAEKRREKVAERFGAAADDLIALFKKAYPGKNEVDLLTQDTFFRYATVEYLDKKSAVASAPVYSYLFTLEFDYDGGKPAWHCSDIPFVFRNTDRVAVCNIEGVTERLEEEVSGAYVNFARSGNPNHKTLPEWPEYKPDHRATMIFDRKIEVRVDHEAELLALMKKVGPPFDASQIFDDDDEEEDSPRAWTY